MKHYFCENCGKYFRANNIKRHIISCTGKLLDYNLQGIEIEVPKRHCHPITHWKWDEIQKFYDDSHNVDEVVAKFKISPTAVTKANKLGLIKLRTNTETGKLKNSYIGPLSDYQKHRISEGMKRAVREGRQKTPNPYGKCLNHCKYNENITLHSSWEVKVAKFLDENKITWTRPNTGHEYMFEDSQHMYFPDFYLPDYSLYIEVKGWIQPKDLCKWRDFKYKLLVIDKNLINKLDCKLFIESRGSGA